MSFKDQQKEYDKEIEGAKTQSPLFYEMWAKVQAKYVEPYETYKDRVIELGAEIMRKQFLDMQVCVPDDWSIPDIEEFANRLNTCGTTKGWLIRTDEKKNIDRVHCSKSDRKGFVHVVLGC